MSTIHIRPETLADHEAIFDVNMRAFGSPAEGRLVDGLRDEITPFLSLVAERDGKVVGHILFTPVHVGDEEFLALGPLAVAPDAQRRGIGSELVRAGLEECRRHGARAVFVVGHAGFYPRFGFESAARRGFEFATPVNEEVFRVLELVPGALAECRGRVRYHPAFDDM